MARPLTPQRIAAGLMLLACLGCFNRGDRPDLGTVSGTITLDGEPLPRAVVSFTPKGVRGASGFTDETGRYELRYLRGMGAPVGTHTVRINLPGEGPDAAKRPRLPAKYNRKSTITREVKPGANVFDFKLESE